MAKKNVGGIASMLNKSGVKPKMVVHAYMSQGDEPVEVDDSQYLKDDMDRSTKTIDAIEKQLETWVPEDIAAKVKKQLEAELDRERIRVAELKAQLKIREARK